MYKTCLETKLRVLGADHPDYLTSVNNLAGLYEAQGKFDEARELTAEDLPPTMVAANLEYYRSLLTPKRDWGELRGATAESK